MGTVKRKRERVHFRLEGDGIKELDFVEFVEADNLTATSYYGSQPLCKRQLRGKFSRGTRPPQRRYS